MMVVFEIIGIVAVIVGGCLLVAKLFDIHEDWDDMKWNVKKNIPSQIDILFKHYEELATDLYKVKQSLEPKVVEENAVEKETFVEDPNVTYTCKTENDIASLCERMTILEQYVKLLAENNRIIPMGIPYQADLEKDVVKTSVYPEEE